MHWSGYEKKSVDFIVVERNKHIFNDLQVHERHHYEWRAVLIIFENDLKLLADECGFEGEKRRRFIEEAGSIGQNLTLKSVQGDLNIGDLVLVGDDGVLLEISGCRKPCPKNNRVHENVKLRAAMDELALGGVFARVLRGGTIKAHDGARLLQRQHSLSARQIHRYLHSKAERTLDVTLLRRMAHCRALGERHYRAVARYRLNQVECNNATAETLKWSVQDAPNDFSATEEQRALAAKAAIYGTKTRSASDSAFAWNALALSCATVGAILAFQFYQRR